MPLNPKEIVKDLYHIAASEFKQSLKLEGVLTVETLETIPNNELKQSMPL